VGVLVAHLIWCAARVPSRVFARRLQDVEDYRVRGAARFFLDGRQHGGAEVVRWIQEHVPADAVVLWRGEMQGALEFVPALLAPRLLVAESACPVSSRSYMGRPLGVRRETDGSEAVIVVNGLGDDLRLETR
jgi:hypothetical protein